MLLLFTICSAGYFFWPFTPQTWLIDWLEFGRSSGQKIFLLSPDLICRSPSQVISHSPLSPLHFFIITASITPFLPLFSLSFFFVTLIIIIQKWKTTSNHLHFSIFSFFESRPFHFFFFSLSSFFLYPRDQNRKMQMIPLSHILVGECSSNLFSFFLFHCFSVFPSNWLTDNV